jgi:hypothetical protein
VPSWAKPALARTRSEGSLKVLAEHIGPHKILWATDYPHRDGFSPGAPQMIKDRMAGAGPPTFGTKS